MFMLKAFQCAESRGVDGLSSLPVSAEHMAAHGLTVRSAASTHQHISAPGCSDISLALVHSFVKETSKAFLTPAQRCTWRLCEI